MLDDFDLDIPEEEFDEEGEGAPRSRTFMMIAGGLGAIIIIAVICIGVWSFMNREDPAVAAQSQTQTVIAQMAAETLGLPLDRITILPTDTGLIPDSGPTVASRTTVFSGNALLDALLQIKETSKLSFNSLVAMSRDKEQRRA